MPEYIDNSDGRFWWCNSHQYAATKVLVHDDGSISRHCNPPRGKILLPCRCVDLTDEIEIISCG